VRPAHGSRPAGWGVLGRVLVGLVAGTALLSCTADRDERAAERPTESAGSPASASESTGSQARELPSGSSSSRAAEIAPPPEQGCYRLGFEALTEPSNHSDPVPCSTKHDAQTIQVGGLDTTVDGHQVAVDSDRVLEQVSSTCPRRLARHLGGSVEDRRLSRFESIWFVPTLGQSDQGASWFRCDVVALAGQERLFPLPPPRLLRGILDGSDGARFGLCGTAAPGTEGFERVICARRHSWRAVSTIALQDARRYPGVRSVRAAGDEMCSDRVRARADDPLKFRYGWEWPTPEQWEGGQHFGYCWAPD
jgi:hypothetical protein